MKEQAVESHFAFKSNAGSDPKVLIAELIALAQEQPPGAVMQTVHERAPIYAQATSSVESVYEHWLAARTQGMRPPRPMSAQRGQRG